MNTQDSSQTNFAVLCSFSGPATIMTILPTWSKASRAFRFLALHTLESRPGSFSLMTSIPDICKPTISILPSAALMMPNCVSVLGYERGICGLVADIRYIFGCTAMKFGLHHSLWVFLFYLFPKGALSFMPGLLRFCVTCLATSEVQSVLVAHGYCREI